MGNSMVTGGTGAVAGRRSATAARSLGRCPPAEAIADVGAAASLARFSYVTNETLCASVSQLFCGRVGWMPVLDAPPPFHPPTNMRGDNVCAFLRAHFAS